LDIALGFGCLAVSMAVCIWVSAHPVPKAAAVLVSAGLIGYWVAYLQLFIHEGAHFNLAHDRRRSDLICDALIAWMVGTGVRKYRKIHFQHHRALGTVDDSEFSYFFPLNLMFLAKSLFAVRTIDVLLSRRRYLSRSAPETPRAIPDRSEMEADTPESWAGKTDLAMIGGALAHLSIVVTAWLAGSGALALAWVIGVGMIFPLLGATRQ